MKADIKHLANLSRLHLEESEIEEYSKQFDEIVSYVDKIRDVAALAGDQVIESSDVRNVMRDDVVKSYDNPEQIIDAAPANQDNFVRVKKILNN